METNDTLKSTLFKKYFINYFWLGFILVLFSIIFEKTSNQMGILKNILVDLLATLGITILIASLFSFASNTADFIDKIKSLLQDIIINRDFLKDIDAASKRDVLFNLLKPSNAEKSIYSNVEDFYRRKIEETLEIPLKALRSNYNIFISSFHDDVTKRIISKYSISYRLYPTLNGFNEFLFGFDDEDNVQMAELKQIIISSPNGNVQSYKEFEYKNENIMGNQLRLVAYFNANQN